MYGSVDFVLNLGNADMAKRRDADPQPQPPPTRREKLAEARRKARLKRSAREKWIIDKLNRGMSITVLAARQGVTLRRMQIFCGRYSPGERLRRPPNIWRYRSTV